MPSKPRISDLIIAFARPLLDAMGKPRSLDDLRSAMDLASMCWNLPVLERSGKAEVVAMRQDFDRKIAAMPDPVRSILTRMLAARESELADVPFLVRVEVRGKSLEDCSIYAEARGAPAV